MVIHNEKELQEMFELMGLGKKEDRERFSRLSSDPEKPCEDSVEEYEIINVSNTSKPLSIKPEGPDA